MNTHCPDCGSEFAVQRDLKRHWLRLLKCGKCVEGWILEVADSKWIYPLQRLDPGVGKQLQEADEKRIQEAVPRGRGSVPIFLLIFEYIRRSGGLHPRSPFRLSKRCPSWIGTCLLETLPENIQKIRVPCSALQIDKNIFFFQRFHAPN